jgi:hypothetical protein
MNADIPSVEWIQEASEKDYLSLIEHLDAKRREIQDREVLFYPALQGQPFSQSGRVVIETLRGKKRKNPAIAANIHLFLFKKFIPLLEELEKLGFTKLSSGKSDTYVNKMQACANEIRNIYLGDAAAAPIMGTWKAPESVKRLFGFGKPKQLLSSQVPVPTNSYAITEKTAPRCFQLMNDVIALQRYAVTLASTPEESYFLEQVEKSYLPSIVETANALKGASKEVLDKAVMNFEKQLEMIRDRLQLMIDTSSNNTLRSVETQTAFLEERLKTVEPLKLDK